MRKKQKLGDRIFGRPILMKPIALLLYYIAVFYHIAEFALIGLACTAVAIGFVTYVLTQLFNPVLWLQISATTEMILNSVLYFPYPTELFTYALYIVVAIIAYGTIVIGGQILLNGMSDIRRSL